MGKYTARCDVASKTTSKYFIEIEVGIAGGVPYSISADVAAFSSALDVAAQSGALYSTAADISSYALGKKYKAALDVSADLRATSYSRRGDIATKARI